MLDTQLFHLTFNQRILEPKNRQLICLLLCITIVFVALILGICGIISAIDKRKSEMYPKSLPMDPSIIIVIICGLIILTIIIIFACVATKNCPCQNDTQECETSDDYKDCYSEDYHKYNRNNYSVQYNEKSVIDDWENSCSYHEEPI